MNIRTAAMDIITQVSQKRNTLTTLLADSKHVISDNQALLQALCYGVCRWYIQLDFILTQLVKKPVKDLDIKHLIFIGLYEIEHLSTPDYAAVNEVVNTVAAMGKSWAKPLVNAVLRRYLREQTQINATVQSDEAIYAHPPWYIQRVKTAWADSWQSILLANNQHPPMTLRVNRLTSQRSKYLDQLASLGVDAHVCEFAEDGIRLEKPCHAQQLPKFDLGWVTVQDEASQLAVSLLGLKPGIRVLDACAAPGGKTGYMLELEPTIEVVALDVNIHRLSRLQDNLTRLNQSATIIEGDVCQPAQWWDGQLFDCILLDAPCSAAGVIRRHPDIKLLREPEDIVKLTAQQNKMIKECWQLLRPGGLLVYTTCSILPEENEQIVANFVSQQQDASHQCIHADWGVVRPYGRQLFPTQLGPDGFYYACLKKVH